MGLLQILFHYPATSIAKRKRLTWLKIAKQNVIQIKFTLSQAMVSIMLAKMKMTSV